MNVFITDDLQGARDATRPFVALYVGGMGSRKQNFYNQLMVRYGFEAAAKEVQDLYLEGRKDEAMAALQAWKGKYPAAAERLKPVDVLVDGMRGPSSIWYRIRINLQHVPEEQRPTAEPPDPNEDVDDWSGVTPSEARPRRPARARKGS